LSKKSFYYENEKLFIIDFKENIFNTKENNTKSQFNFFKTNTK